MQHGSQSAARAPVYTIQGRKVEFPVRVRDASSGAATFLVPARAAARLIPGDAFELIEPLPGRTLLSIAIVDYRDNDLGDYDEISIAFFVRRRGAPRGLPVLGSLREIVTQRAAIYIHRLPVNQTFTREAGFEIWGFPKTVDDIRIEHDAERCSCTWSKDGRRVFRFSLPRGGQRRLPERVMTTFSLIRGVPHVTRFSSGAEGAGFRLGGARLELGDHPIADELRALGLPRRALFCAWMERTWGSFEPPEPLGG